MRMRSLTLCAVAVTIAGCGEAEGKAERFTLGEMQGERVSMLAPDLQAEIDGGNTAYRRGDYEAALGFYREAARIAPEQAAGWFGMAMAAGALGNQALADSAQARVRDLSPELGAAPHAGPGAPGHP
jgi:tetratricopeptide (TPR) repeat protein